MTHGQNRSYRFCICKIVFAAVASACHMASLLSTGAARHLLPLTNESEGWDWLQGVHEAHAGREQKFCRWQNRHHMWCLPVQGSLYSWNLRAQACSIIARGTQSWTMRRCYISTSFWTAEARQDGGWPNDVLCACAFFLLTTLVPYHEAATV